MSSQTGVSAGSFASLHPSRLRAIPCSSYSPSPTFFLFHTIQKHRRVCSGVVRSQDRQHIRVLTRTNWTPLQPYPSLVEVGFWPKDRRSTGPPRSLTFKRSSLRRLNRGRFFGAPKFTGSTALPTANTHSDCTAMLDFQYEHHTARRVPK